MSNVASFVSGLFLGGIGGVLLYAFIVGSHSDEVIEPMIEDDICDKTKNEKTYQYKTPTDELDEQGEYNVTNFVETIKDHTAEMYNRIDDVEKKIEAVRQNLTASDVHVEDVPWREITEDEFSSMSDTREIPFKELSYFAGDNVWVDDDNLFVAKPSAEVDDMLQGLDINDVEDGSIYYYEKENFAVRLSKYDYGWHDLNYYPHGVEAHE